MNYHHLIFAWHHPHGIPVIYDLNGRRVKKARAGWYIVDKKIVYLQPKS